MTATAAMTATPRPSSVAARPMLVSQVIRETRDAISLVLEDPTGADVVFMPGQFLTVQVVIGGDVLRRAYSISSDPADRRHVTLTIKRVPGGRVSNDVVEHTSAGDYVQVFGPSGQFVLGPADANVGHVVLIAGGSGITPLMSHARALLRTRADVRVSLLYGNRDADSVIFANALAEMSNAHATRFAVQHVLESMSHADEARLGCESVRAGRMDADTLRSMLDDSRVTPAEPTRVLVCGPDGMMTAAREALRAIGVAPSDLREERFAQPAARTPPRGLNEQTPQGLDIETEAGTLRTLVKGGETLLEAGLAAGAPMRFSCAMGGCGACKVRLAEGTVEMEEPNCLGDVERSRGEVLACVARPTSAVRIEVIS